MAQPVTTDVLVVFALVAVTIALFVREVFPVDVTAIGLLVALVVLEPWTGIGPVDAISGFSNQATITILAMYILSAGVQSTGVVAHLGEQISAFADGNRERLLGTIIGVAGTLAGFINNTPVVAVFIPMVTDLADRNHVSPSKLLIPLSYASMLGGMLTVIGTSTNLLASELSRQLLDHPISMFEFTPIGVVVLLVGSVYLLTVGQWLLPERLIAADLINEFDLEDDLHRVFVGPNSPLVGATVGEALNARTLDLDVLQILRGDDVFVPPLTSRTIKPRDILTVRATPDTVQAFAALDNLRRLPKAVVTEQELHLMEGRGALVEVAIPLGSSFIKKTPEASKLRDRYAATLLGVRSGSTLVKSDLRHVVFKEGDVLLLHATHATVEFLEEKGEIRVVEAGLSGTPTPKALEETWREAVISIAIIVGVIVFAALDVVPIVIAALGGVAVMLAVGIIEPKSAYNAVSWNVVFLLAGVIPLGLALQRSGGAVVLADAVVSLGGSLPNIAMLAVFYLLVGLVANVVTPVASIVLLLPVAVDAANSLGANPFAFVIAVTFAASTAFMTPVGYQTNLMVYSPGGYRFTDFLKVGAPLQLLLAVVTTLAIAVYWGV